MGIKSAAAGKCCSIDAVFRKQPCSPSVITTAPTPFWSMVSAWRESSVISMEAEQLQSSAISAWFGMRISVCRRILSLKEDTAAGFKIVLTLFSFAIRTASSTASIAISVCNRQQAQFSNKWLLLRIVWAVKVAFAPVRSVIIDSPSS